MSLSWRALPPKWSTWFCRHIWRTRSHFLRLNWISVRFDLFTPGPQKICTPGPLRCERLVESLVRLLARSSHRSACCRGLNDFLSHFIPLASGEGLWVFNRAKESIHQEKSQKGNPLTATSKSTGEKVRPNAR